MLKNIVAVILLAAFSMTVSAQSTQSIRTPTSNTDVWFGYTGSHKIADKWSLHLEFQYRLNDGISNKMQWMPRVGITRILSPQATVTAGYAFIETYPYGEFAAKSAFPENRIWEQLQLKHQVSNFEWVSRFRLEQRYVQSPVLEVGFGGSFYTPGPAIFTNRFRLLNRFSMPFKGKTITDNAFYLTAFDEFMINFGENVQKNIFDQNRLFFGIGYKFPKLGRLEVGYMEQTIIKSDAIKVENNHTISMSLSCSLDFIKKKEVVAPK
jgi:Protein of unknown function (DUF2490)